jgi:pimeloyl-ACP methyl ester carboxylesterase
MNLVIGLAVLVVFLPLAGLIYQQLGKSFDHRRYPAPGRFTKIDGQTFHWSGRGHGLTVVLESGIASSSLAWTTIEPILSKETHVFSYDRAGLGWSSSAVRERTLDNVVHELHSLLEQAGVPKRFILVGHSYGGLIVRRFALEFPEEVLGLVLVDPVSPRDWVPLTKFQRARIARGVSLSQRGAVLAQFGVVRLALTILALGGRRLPKLIARWSAGSGASVTERLIAEVGKLPRETWPKIQMHWSDAKCFHTMAEYLERLPQNADAALKAGWPRDIPTILLTTCDPDPDAPPGVVQRLAKDCGHWIHLDRPDLVLDAVRELLHEHTA